ncbi:hypothetical protein AVEN_222780-1 [Araneus ventricosus]|uniref:Uncharacterized protein n=1 Tax=Araneus ventricosus TaxID=182803 RepID=A0A4Y2B226_ARAVE|nr:hypothetical protein AVEN_222780-1 [Araneus ventricosus]
MLATTVDLLARTIFSRAIGGKEKKEEPNDNHEGKKEPSRIPDTSPFGRSQGQTWVRKIQDVERKDVIESVMDDFT